MRSRLYLFLLIILVCGVSISGAQDESDTETHPLYNTMALVPIMPEVLEGLITYTDIRAIEASRGIDTPGTFTEGSGRDSLWVSAVLMSIHSGPQLLQNIFSAGEDWAETVGFDVVDINQLVSFGSPPSDAVILKGDFDPDTMTEALSGLDIEVAEEADDYTLWCWIDGCDQGAVVDLANRNLANPFGGDLGRRQPVAYVAPDIIVNSGGEQLVDFMINLNAAGTGHVLTLPAYRSIANFVTGQEDVLVRHLVFAGNTVTSLNDPAAMLFGDEDVIAALTETLSQFGTLPLYELVAMTDVAFTASGTEQGQMILVYGDEATAQAAVEELTVRLPIVPSLRARTGFMELVEGRDATLLPLEIINDAENGKSLVVISFENDIPPNEENEDGRIVASGRMFNLLIQGIYSRDFVWLVPEILLPE